MIRHIILTTALVLGTSTVGHSDAVEFFRCKLKDGTELSALKPLANEFEAVAAANGLEEYEVSFLSPVFSSHLGRNQFYWVGVTTDMASAGKAVDIWGMEANKAVRDKWNSMVEDCKSSSLHMLMRTPAETEGN